MDESVTVAGLTYLFSLYMEKYCKKHKLTMNEFWEIDDKYHILELIQDGEPFFNDCTTREGMQVIENHVKYCKNQVKN